jgi:glycerophosphoryl diester phosphodiesterase
VKGKKRLVVDAKDADIAPRLMEVLAEEGAAREDVVIFSFEWQVIEESRAIHPDWDVAFLDDELTQDAQEREAEVKRVAQIGCTGIGVSVQRVDQAFVTMAQAAGLMVYVYTANHPKHIEKLLRFGVDAIISDRPDGVLELVEE